MELTPTLLPHDTLRHIPKHCPQISGIISYILAKDSINVCNEFTRISMPIIFVDF